MSLAISAATLPRFNLEAIHKMSYVVLLDCLIKSHGLAILVEAITLEKAQAHDTLILGTPVSTP